MRLILCVLVLGAVFRVVIYKSHIETVFKPGNTLKITTRVADEPLKTWSGDRKFYFKGMEARLPKGSEVHSGDKITFVGTVNSRVIGNNGVKNWLEIGKIDQIQPRSELFVKLVSFRYLIVNNFNNFLSPKPAALASGLVWGEDQEFTPEMKQDFKKSGLSHLVAASGYNVSLIAACLVAFFSRMISRTKAGIISIFFIVLYVFMAGGTIPVVRAGVLAVYALIGQALGKQVNAKIGLIILGCISVILFPQWFWEISWQLSYAATAGILFLSNTPTRFLLQKGVKTSLAAYTATFPILVYHFGYVSVSGLVANLLVEPVVGIATQLGIIVSILGFISGLVGQALAYLLLPFLSYVLIVANTLAKIPVWETGEWSGLSVAIYYLLLIGIVYKWTRR